MPTRKGEVKRIGQHSEKADMLAIVVWMEDGANASFRVSDKDEEWLRVLGRYGGKVRVTVEAEED